MLANSVAVQTMMDILTNSSDSSSESDTQRLIIGRLSSTVATGIQPVDLGSSNLHSLLSELTADTSRQTTVASRLSDLNAEIKKIGTAADTSAVNAQLKVSEVISQLVKKEISGTDRSAAQTVLNSGISTLSTNLQSGFNDDTVEFDISSITKTLVDSGQTAIDTSSSFDPSTSVTNAVNDAKLANDTTWGGQWFVLEATSEHADDLATGSYVAIRLDGTADAKQGHLSACVNVSAKDSTDPEDSLVNEYMGGSWTKISAGAVILNLDYEGQSFEGIIKAKVMESSDSQQQFRFTTDIDGTTESGDLLLSPNTVNLANVAKPASADDCATLIDPLL
ncbi:MAG: hypothetical protein P8X79_13040 [Reinekea sp.]